MFRRPPILACCRGFVGEKITFSLGIGPWKLPDRIETEGPTVGALYERLPSRKFGKVTFTDHPSSFGRRIDPRAPPKSMFAEVLRGPTSWWCYIVAHESDS